MSDWSSDVCSSDLKIFHTAMALEAGTVTMRGGYDATHPIRIARFTINDDHPKARWLSVPEIFKYSSNIGSVKMAMDVGTEGQRAFMATLGMLRETSIEIPERVPPMVPSQRRPTNPMTIASGNGPTAT